MLLSSPEGEGSDQQTPLFVKDVLLAFSFRDLSDAGHETRAPGFF